MVREVQGFEASRRAGRFLCFLFPISGYHIDQGRCGRLKKSEVVGLRELLCCFNGLPKLGYSVSCMVEPI